MATQATTGLTDQIRHSVNNPLTTTDFDFTNCPRRCAEHCRSQRHGRWWRACASTAEPTR